MLQPQYLFNKYSALFLKIGILIFYVFVSYFFLNSKQIVPIFIDILFFLPFLDYKNVLNLKNYYCVYVFLIFKISTQFFYPDNYQLTFDGTLFFVTFLLGYEIKTALSDNTITVKPDTSNVEYRKYITMLNFLIKVFVGLKLLLLAMLIYQYGFVSFYSGQMLADFITNYGRVSAVDTFFTIYTAFVNNFLTAIIALYIKYISALGEKPNYYKLCVVMLVLPLLLLSRSTFAFNLVALLAIYYYFNKSSVKIYAIIIPGIFILIGVSTYIGLLRSNSYSSTQGVSDESYDTQFFSEFTPIIPYRNTRENIHILKYQYGKTIFLPLLTKVIPRSTWKTKPENSSAYYNREFDYENFAAGFSMPLMLFGDLFLNFGMVVTLILLLLFGCFISKMNHFYLTGNYRYIDKYFILFMLFYPVLRNNVPESVLYLLLSFFAMKFISFFVLKAPIEE